MKAVKKIGRICGKRYKKSFIAFEHTLCLTKNLPFCLEYIYFIYICSILCFCFSFLFILGDVGGRGVHRSAHMKWIRACEMSTYLNAFFKFILKLYMYCMNIHCIVHCRMRNKILTVDGNTQIYSKIHIPLKQSKT